LAIVAISTAVHATRAAVTAVASLASVAAAAVEIVAEVAAPPSGRHIVAEAALFAIRAASSVAHVATHGLMFAVARSERRRCCRRRRSIVRRLSHEADRLPVVLLRIVLLAGTLCAALCQLVLNHLRLRAHCGYPDQVAQAILDAVRGVQARVHAAVLRVLPAGLLNGGHNARELLVRLLVDTGASKRVSIVAQLSAASQRNTSNCDSSDRR